MKIRKISVRRVLSVTAIVNEISNSKYDLDPSLFETSLDLLIDLLAQSVEENQTLPFDMLDLVSCYFGSRPSRADIYGLLSRKIFQALYSDSISHMSSALLILQVILIDAPDCSLGDASKIADIIMKGVASENPLLVQAAASVVEVFKGTGKFNLRADFQT